MRIRNSFRNIGFGLLGQLASTVLGFIVRYLFIATLGIEYLGVSGLFSDLLMMLSLANLGFETAVIFSLYKPLAQGDTSKVRAYMTLYGKAYRIIGLVILAAGLAVLPLLPWLIHGGTAIPHLELYYLLFLLNSVSSYFFVYKQAVIVADQRQYIISKIHTVHIVISNAIQIVLLVLLRNYAVVLAAQIVLGIAKNAYIARRTDRLYPYLREHRTANLSAEERGQFFRNLGSLMIYKVSGVVINGTDNVIISKLFGLAWVGIYSNYYLILTTLSTFIGYIFYSVAASVGNVNAAESEEKKHEIFRVLHFANFWVFGLSTVCLWSLINPFVSLWIGSQYVLDRWVLLAVLLNFYTTGMQNAATTVRDASGTFRLGKYGPLAAAFLNIGVSLYLADRIGLAGVFLGTVVSRLLTFFWYDPFLLYRHVFHKKVLPYFIRSLAYGATVLAVAFGCDLLGRLAPAEPAAELAVRAAICLAAANAVFYALYGRTGEFAYVMGAFKRLGAGMPSLRSKRAGIGKETG